jgi:tetratricopeptide (TPR) repeat protein
VERFEADRGHMSFVFVSHASPDKRRVRPVVDALLEAGLKVWIDNPAAAGYSDEEVKRLYRIRAGNRWEDEIDDAKKEASCILVCFSRHAISDGVLGGTERHTWVEEIGYARTEKKLVACIVDDVSPEELPSTYAAQQIPSVNPDLPSDDWKVAMATLISDIRKKIEADRRLNKSTALHLYLEGLRTFCERSTYTLTDKLPSDAESLFVDIEGRLATIEALSAQARGHTSGKPSTTVSTTKLLAEIIGKGGSAVLCGGAGTGKSTLVRRFARLVWDDADKLHLVKRCLPILVRLRYLALAQGETFEEKIRYALRAAGDFTPGQAIPDDFLEVWPQETNAALLFLFDGLDEVASSDRRRLLTFLDQLRSRFTNASVIITTRDSELVRGSSFASTEKTGCIAMHPLSPAAALNIARALLDNIELRRFLQERDRGRSFAFDTALGVRMASAIIKRDQMLPTTRGEFYESLIRQSFGDDEDNAAPIPEALENDEGILQVLQALALVNFDPIFGSSRSIEQAVAEALKQLRPTVSEHLARGAVPEVLNWIKRRGGVLTATDPLTWSHETCREYLVARYLTGRIAPDDPKIVELAKRACSEPRLRSVLLFSFSEWTRATSYDQLPMRSELAERVVATLRPALEEISQDSSIPLNPQGTLLLAEILAELRPVRTAAVDAVIHQLAELHQDFIGYFDEPKQRCNGDENVNLCLRRWADHPPLLEAMQPIADRYEKLLQRFDLAQSGVVHFLIIAGRRSAVLAAVMSDRVKGNYQLLEVLRGAVAAEGPSGDVALVVARSIANSTHPALKVPPPRSTETRFIRGSKGEFADERVWLTPEVNLDGAENYIYNWAFSAALDTLYEAGFVDEVSQKLAEKATGIETYAYSIGAKRFANGMARRFALDASLSNVKRAFAFAVLNEQGALDGLSAEEILPVLSEVEKDTAHTKWAAPLKSAYCEKIRNFDEMRTSCRLAIRVEPDNAKAWFDLGWSSYHLLNFEEALSAFQRSIAVGRDGIEGQYFCGLSLLRLHRYAEAVAAFDSAAELGNDQLRLWEARLEAKYFASWYKSLRADVDFLCENNHQDRPFVRHWMAIARCLSGEFEEAMKLFGLLEEQPYRSNQIPYFKTLALIGLSQYSEAADYLKGFQFDGAWDWVLRACIAKAAGLDLDDALGRNRDAILAKASTGDEFESAFWLCSALNDSEGARRCVENLISDQDAARIHTLYAALGTILYQLKRPWSDRVLERGLQRVNYPSPPFLSGADIVKRRIERGKSRTQSQIRPVGNNIGGPKSKRLYRYGMLCRLRSIAGYDEEQELANGLLVAHAKGLRTVAIIRLGTTRHMFGLCNFKFAKVDVADMKFSAPIDHYLSYEGNCPMLDQLVEPFGVRKIICNDLQFLNQIRSALKTRWPVEYEFVQGSPDFKGRSIFYEEVG